MAKITFQYRSKKDTGNLTIRLTHGTSQNGIDIRTSIPIQSKKEYWLNSLGKRRKNPQFKTAEGKNHKTKLENLKGKIENAFIHDLNNAELITVEWLKDKVREYNPTRNSKKDIAEALDQKKNFKKMNLLTNAVESIFIKYQTNERELKKYKVTLNLLKKYENHRGKEFEIKDVNNRFADEFRNWCYLEMSYSQSYINAQLKRIRTSVNYAYTNDEEDIIKISKQLNSFDYFRNPYKDKIVVTLDYDDLDRIDRTELDDTSLLEAKKAILFGCETGLRYNDMNKLVDVNIKNIMGVNYWMFRTSKTGSKVKITISDRLLYLINKYGLPSTKYPKNEIKLNRDIKTVCKIAKINESTKGLKCVVLDINGKKEKRNKVDFYPKYELIATRTLRRSFATNYYGKIDTQLIMDVTGHKTEKMLRAYIMVEDNSNIIRSKNQIDQFHKNRKEEKNNIKLTKIPKISNFG